MLQNIRDNSQGWIAKSIIGVIVVLLSLTGFESIMSFTSNSDNAAAVNGEPILKAELDQMVLMQRQQLQRQLGAGFDPALLEDRLLRDSVLKSLIERQIILQGARESGLVFPPAAMDQLLLTAPEFQANGSFSPALFDQFVRERNMNRLQFRKALEDEIIIGQARAGVAGSSFVTPDEVDAFVRLERQTRDFDSLLLLAEPEKVLVSDEEVQAFYDANADRFMSEEQVVLEYVELKKDAFFDQAEVSEEDLKALYEQEVAGLAEQRRAAHILIEVNDKVSNEAALEQIEALAQRVAAGEDFAALAKEFSQDPGSKDEGGDLGFAAPGVFEPSFEEALYALQKGQVSAPVSTPYGWHLIKLLDTQAPELPSFDSLKEQLTAELKSQQVERRFVEAGQLLETSAYEASDLSQPAQELGLEVKTTAPFGRNGGAEGVSANRQIVREAFSEEFLEERRNSQLVELDASTQVVFRVKDHLKSEPLALPVVAEAIRAELTDERARAEVRERGEALLAKLRAGEATGVSGWTEVEAATRSQDGVDPAVLKAVFRMPKAVSSSEPAYAGVLTNTGDYALIRLTAVSEPEDALSDEEKQMYARFLASRDGEQTYAAYTQALKAGVEVETFE